MPLPVSPFAASADDDDRFMGYALEAARAAGDAGDVPVGAVVVDRDGMVIATAWNEREVAGDPTAHAEILALREAAGVVGSWRLEGCTLVVTLEPCSMCAGATVLARVPRLVIGAMDPKTGACGSLWNVPQDERLNHFVDTTTGVRGQECSEMLRAFFRARRAAKNRPPHGVDEAGGS